MKNDNNNNSLKEIALLFLKLGIIGFGGPAAHIAMMEEEVVRKRKWMDQQEFLDLMGATNLIPGPNSTEMTMHCGMKRAGWKGLIVAGTCFLTPAIILTALLAWFYVKTQSIPAIAPLFYGIKPAVLAIIIGAVYKLGKKAFKNNTLIFVGILVAVATLAGIREVYSIFLGGFLGYLLLYFQATQNKNGPQKQALIPAFLGSFTLLYPQVAQQLMQLNKENPTGLLSDTLTNSKLFLVFLKIGFILFGSGYVLVAYLQDELVDKLGWLTQQELLDAIAMGQFTPGPVLSTATFVGFQLNSWTGAVVASIGIFLPSFLL